MQELTIRNVGLIPQRERVELPERGTGLVTGTAGERRAGVPRTEAERAVRHPVTRVPVMRRLEEEEEKQDPLRTLIDKMEEIRPVCPVEAIEDAWTKFTSWFKDTTPEIPVLPKPEEEEVLK